MQGRVAIGCTAFVICLARKLLVSVLLSYAKLFDKACYAAADQGTTHIQVASCHT